MLRTASANGANNEMSSFHSLGNSYRIKPAGCPITTTGNGLLIMLICWLKTSPPSMVSNPASLHRNDDRHTVGSLRPHLFATLFDLTKTIPRISDSDASVLLKAAGVDVLWSLHTPFLSVQVAFQQIISHSPDAKIW